jgi:branched-chain amino acid transport system permease protein
VFTELAIVIIGGVKFGAVYALAAVGLVVVHKGTRTVNFAHGAFVMLGAFGAYLFVVMFELPYALAYLVVPLLVGTLAFAAEFSVLRVMRRADLFTVVIATVYLGILLSEAFRLYYKAELLAVPGVFAGMPLIIADAAITRETMWVVAGALLATIASILIFSYGSVGRGIRAIAENPRGAQLCGYSIDRAYALIWFLGGVLAGIAGIFIAPIKGVSAELSIAVIIPAFVAAVIGGFESLGGAILGGLILGLGESLAAAYVSSAMKNCVSFLLLFVVLMWRPNGLFAAGSVRNV